MTVRRALERVEANLPARRADQVFPAWVTAGARAALYDVPGGLARVTADPRWAAALTPFPAYLTEKGVAAEVGQRLGLVVSVIEDVAGREKAALMLSVLTLKGIC